MKRKFLIASHGNLAKGFQSSLDILADKGKELAVINAYVTPEDYTPIIQTFLQSLGAEEQAIILTDLYGGSVNQKIVQEVMTTKPDNVFISHCLVADFLKRRRKANQRRYSSSNC